MLLLPGSLGWRQVISVGVLWRHVDTRSSSLMCTLDDPLSQSHSLIYLTNIIGHFLDAKNSEIKDTVLTTKANPFTPLGHSTYTKFCTVSFIALEKLNYMNF